MTLSLDTSIIADIERNYRPTINTINELKEQYMGIPSLPFMAYMESLYGLNIKSKKNQHKLVKLLELFHLLLPSKSTAKTFAKLKYKYDKMGKCISFTDLFIAAQTIDEGLVLVTKDKVFSQIEELDVVIL